MIDLAISRHHAENVVRLTRIEDRILGIDGNGSGRKGVLQRQDEKLEQMSGEIRDVKTDVAEVKDGQNVLLQRSQSWSKKNVWEFAKWIIGGAGSFAVVLAGMWLGHKMGWVH